MEASIVDLRYDTKNVILALRRNEKVKIYYHNKLIGTIVPERPKLGKKKLKNHPFFGMYSDEKQSVEWQMDRLRGERYS